MKFFRKIKIAFLMGLSAFFEALVTPDFDDFEAGFHEDHELSEIDSGLSDLEVREFNKHYNRFTLDE